MGTVGPPPQGTAATPCSAGAGGIWGGNGDDELHGGRGNDLLAGGPGLDMLYDGTPLKKKAK
jgi:Ca2+-binding RTX toxin-like protein